jgi:hypothetical protein
MTSFLSKGALTLDEEQHEEQHYIGVLLTAASMQSKQQTGAIKACNKQV